VADIRRWAAASATFVMRELAKVSTLNILYPDFVFIVVQNSAWMGQQNQRKVGDYAFDPQN
jgi:hypothetical protein